MLGGLLKPSEGPPQYKAKKIIIDTDGGCDDVMALMSLYGYLKSIGQEGSILGVTCVWGNTSLQNVTRNIMICRSLSSANYPIYAGCKLSMTGRHYSDSYFGEDGLNNYQKKYMPKQKGEIETLHAVDFIAQSIKRYPKEITIITLGPLTNLGAVFVKSPELADKLGRLVAMGGNYLGVGLVKAHPNAEFNFHCDGCDTELVFRLVESPIIVPLQTCIDVTSQSASQLQQLFEGDKENNKFFGQIFQGTEKMIADPLACLMAVDCKAATEWLDIKALIEFDGGTTAIKPSWFRVSEECRQIWIVSKMNIPKVVKFCMKAA